jgi:hypothetical protein
VKLEGQHRSGTEETGDSVGDGNGAVGVGNGRTAGGAVTGEAVCSQGQLQSWIVSSKTIPLGHE